MKKAPPRTFWVTNISDRNVSLCDLGLTIRAGATVNLLDSRHYHLTEQQLETSAATGSIATKNDKIKVRKVPPSTLKTVPKLQETSFIPSRKISRVEVIPPKHVELDMSDEKFAEQNADLAETDRRPRLPNT